MERPTLTTSLQQNLIFAGTNRPTSLETILKMTTIQRSAMIIMIRLAEIAHPDLEMIENIIDIIIIETV
ncbi:hypothetical protein BGW41_006217 [Actinomortierella wolfii]|nr:hypothetical protein BGW41_006217 [Actinomortierella wolfii]